MLVSSHRYFYNVKTGRAALKLAEPRLNRLKPPELRMSLKIREHFLNCWNQSAQLSLMNHHTTGNISRRAGCSKLAVRDSCRQLSPYMYDDRATHNP